VGEKARLVKYSRTNASESARVDESGAEWMVTGRSLYECLTLEDLQELVGDPEGITA